MKVAIIGTGRVGLSLLHFIVNHPKIETVFVISRKENSVKSAIMEVASAYAKSSQKIKAASKEDLSQADVIVMTAGAQMKVGETPQDVKQDNEKIAKNIFEALPLKSNAIIIVVPTPVDDLTVYIQKLVQLPKNQVIGFGGDLDYQRLLAVLLEKNIATDNIHVIGEHGEHVIPVYPCEKDYDEVTKRVRCFLSTITEYANAPLNLATGILLNQLIHSLLNEEGKVHYVCGYHPNYDRYLTWAFLMGHTGTLQPVDLVDQMGIHADNNLTNYLRIM